MHGAESLGGGGGGGHSPAPLPALIAERPRGERLFPLVALAVALCLHALLAAGLSTYSSYKLQHPDAVPQSAPIEVAVIERPPPPPTPKAAEPPKPLPKPVPMKIARAPRVKPTTAPPPRAAPPPPDTAPPPPTAEAKTVTKEPIRVIAGIFENSTVSGGTFAAPVGNTLRGTPGKVAVAPAEVKPYKAERYAAASTVNELPSVLNREAVDLRKFYPPDALKKEFEGEVVLRLLIDSDGSVAKADVVTDPGQGLGQAAVRAVHAYRFSPGKVNGSAVATTVPFVIRFVIN